MKYCSKCGKETTDDAAFCQNCGNAFPQSNGYLPQAFHPKTDALSNASPNKVRKTGTIIIATVLVLILAVAGGVWGWQNYVQTKKAPESNGLAVVSEDKTTAAAYPDNPAKTSIDEPKLYPVEIGKLWGFIDRNGNMVIQPQYKDVKQFSEGLAAVRGENNLWDYIDGNGNKVIKGQFKRVENFSDGMASIAYFDGEHTKYAYINRNGNIIFKTELSKNPFYDGLVWAGSKGKGGFIDQTGKMVIPQIYDDVGRHPFAAGQDFGYGFSEGLAAVEVNHKWGYIDTAGKMVMQPQYGGATSFCDGMALVDLGETGAFIDKTGRIIFKPDPKVKLYGWWFEGRIPVKAANGKIGFLDYSGNMAVQPQYDEVGSFNEGLAAVMINGSWGYIGLDGTMIIPTQYKKAGSFNGGLALVIIGENQMLYIDANGNKIWPK